MTHTKLLSEKELIRLIVSGDISAKKRLYCQYAGYLVGVCARYVSDYEEVKDIIQEVFLKTFSSIDRFDYRGDGSLLGWMTKITVNESLKFLKNRYRFEEISVIVEEDHEIAEESPEIGGIPPTELHTMIKELPPGYRTILNLYVFEEKSHKEIASLLGIKESTSASQFHRAKNLLAEKIKKYNNS